jgi:hypothetical protein
MKKFVGEENNILSYRLTRAAKAGKKFDYTGTTRPTKQQGRTPLIFFPRVHIGSTQQSAGATPIIFTNFLFNL